MSAAGRQSVSVVVPVFNEAGNILPLALEVASALDPAHLDWELVYIDDASTDATWEKILEARARNPRVRGLRHARNAGQSAAVWTGLQQSHHPLIATLDGDRQNDPAELPRLLETLHTRSAAMVCGRRVDRQDTAVRRLSSRVAFLARKWTLGASFQDTGCALRVFRRDVLDSLSPFNGLHRFLPILVQAPDRPVLEIPVRHRPRIEGVSKYGVWNRVWRGMFDLVGVAWYLRRRLRTIPIDRQT